MLNVCLEQKITQYKPSFKSKNDYSQIYKEMEKITLRRDEKIIPKISLGENFSRIKENIGGVFDSIKSKIIYVKRKRNIKKQNTGFGFNRSAIKDNSIYHDPSSTKSMIIPFIKGGIVAIPIGTILGLWSIAAIEGQSLNDYLFNEKKQPTEIKNDKPDKLETDSIKQSETPKPALTPRWI